MVILHVRIDRLNAHETCTTRFLSIMQQECQRMDALLRDMTATLGQLKLALAGKLAMSDDLHAAFADILVNRVPSKCLVTNSGSLLASAGIHCFPFDVVVSLLLFRHLPLSMGLYQIFGSLV